MDDFDDILLDDYEPFSDNEKDDDPLDPLAAPTKGKKRSSNDKDDTTENNLPSKKQRRKTKKLDHKVLCESSGLPRLRNETPFLQFRGKGYEDEDLQKLMRYYQMWALKIYPKLNFTDFSSRVLKASGEKPCKLLLSQWREEYIFKNSPDGPQDRVTGGLSGMTLEDEDNARRSSDEKKDGSSDNNDSSDDDQGPPLSISATSPTKPTTNNHDDVAAIMGDDDDDDDDLDDAPLFTKAPPTTSNPSITPFMSVDDFFAD